MSKTNFFSKYLKNIGNLINSLLEKNLNKLNFKNLIKEFGLLILFLKAYKVLF